jgi:hypothetical protein
MAALTSFAGRASAEEVRAPQQIGVVRYCFEMCWIYAPPISAQVVDL